MKKRIQPPKKTFTGHLSGSGTSGQHWFLCKTAVNPVFLCVCGIAVHYSKDPVFRRSVIEALTLSLTLLTITLLTIDLLTLILTLTLTFRIVHLRNSGPSE